MRCASGGGGGGVLGGWRLEDAEESPQLDHGLLADALDVAECLIGAWGVVVEHAAGAAGLQDHHAD